jgi:hypothetical protein
MRALVYMWVLCLSVWLILEFRAEWDDSRQLMMHLGAAEARLLEEEGIDSDLALALQLSLQADETLAGSPAEAPMADVATLDSPFRDDRAQAWVDGSDEEGDRAFLSQAESPASEGQQAVSGDTLLAMDARLEESADPIVDGAAGSAMMMPQQQPPVPDTDVDDQQTPRDYTVGISDYTVETSDYVVDLGLQTEPSLELTDYTVDMGDYMVETSDYVVETVLSSPSSQPEVEDGSGGSSSLQTAPPPAAAATAAAATTQLEREVAAPLAPEPEQLEPAPELAVAPPVPAELHSTPETQPAPEAASDLASVPTLGPAA